MGDEESEQHTFASGGDVSTEGCPDCGASPEEVIRSGEELVCGACGLVLSMDYVQVDVEVTSTSEGRVLQGSFVPFRDGERKIVSQAPGLPIHARERGDARTPAFRSLARLATALQSTGVLERARALLRHAYSTPNTRLRRSTKALVAACLYLAVREEGHARTLHEVATAAGVDRGDLMRLVPLLSGLCGTPRPMPVQPQELVTRLVGWMKAADRPRAVALARAILQLVAECPPLSAKSPGAFEACAPPLMAAGAVTLAVELKFAAAYGLAQALEQIVAASSAPLSVMSVRRRAAQLKKGLVAVAARLLPSLAVDCTEATLGAYIDDMVAHASLTTLLRDAPSDVVDRPARLDIVVSAADNEKADEPIADEDIDIYLRTAEEIAMIRQLTGGDTL